MAYEKSEAAFSSSPSILFKLLQKECEAKEEIDKDLVKASLSAFYEFIQQEDVGKKVMAEDLQTVQYKV